MADTIPLFILDAVVLPGPGTEIYLDPTEAAALRAQWADDASSGRAVALGARPPFAAPAPGPPGTPGPLLAACVVGTGSLVEDAAGAGPEGDGPRLVLRDLSRARLASVTALVLPSTSAAPSPVGEPAAPGRASAPDGWLCGVESWPLVAGERTAAQVEALARRFLRLLLATADPHEPRAIEAPVQELAQASGARAKLFVLADYLFEAPSARVHALTAEGVDALADQVEDALALMEEGVPVHPGTLRGPLGAYVRRATQEPVEALERVASTLRAMADLVRPSGPAAEADTPPDEPQDALGGAIEALAQAAGEAAARAEAVTRLLAGRAKRGKQSRRGGARR